MLAVVVLAGWDELEVVDWARVCADKARIDAIRTRMRVEESVEDAIVMIRDGRAVNSECGESATSVTVKWNLDGVKNERDL
jgi:hypothetical protein